MTTIIKRFEKAVLTQVKLALAEANTVIPIPFARLSTDWKLIIGAGTEIFELNLQDLATGLKVDELSLFLLSGFGANQTPGNSGGIAHAMLPNNGYPAAWIFEPDGGGVGDVFWSIIDHKIHVGVIKKERPLINFAGSNKFGVDFEIVRGFGIPGFTRGQVAELEMGEEAGKLVSFDAPFVFLGSGNCNNARATTKPVHENGFAYMGVEIPSSMLQPSSEGPFFVFNPGVFEASPEKESKTMAPLIFVPAKGPGSPFDQTVFNTPSEQFTLTGIGYLEHMLMEQGRLSYAVV